MTQSELGCGMGMSRDMPPRSEEDEKRSLKTYTPLLLILAYLLGGVVIIESGSGYWDSMRAMNHFMGGFFLIFSFFKFLNLKGFVEAYRTYDLVAKAVPSYGWLYPFIELSLGLAYCTQSYLGLAHWVTFVVMAGSSVGVFKAILKKEAIQCACLGTVFNLPMTQVTLFEDLLMAVMAALGIFMENS